MFLIFWYDLRFRLPIFFNDYVSQVNVFGYESGSVPFGPHKL